MGERVPLILAFSSAFLSYFLMGIADNLTVLFLSRLPSVLMHVMQGEMFFFRLKNVVQ
jgi:OCT family organic cation transporter-like MFS transporter 18